MSAVERAVPRIDVLHSKTAVEDPAIKLSNDSDGSDRCYDKRLSRVSRLRDMFQTGVVRPIEEFDTVAHPLEPSETCRVNAHNHFLRAFPGSPPLCALRSHRGRVAQQPEPSKHVLSGPICNSPVTSPPARPPKPRHLTLDSSVPSKPPPTLPKIPVPVELKKPTSDMVRHTKGQESLTSSEAPTISVSAVNEVTVPGKQAASDPLDDTAIHISNSHGSTPTSAITSQVLNLDVLDVPLIEPNAAASPVPPVICDEPADRSSEHGDAAGDFEGSKLSSWQCSSTLNRISPPVTDEVPAYQDFILNSEAFYNSSQFVTEAVTTTGSLPGLQHAEPIAVVSPDDEDSEDAGSGYLTSSLPVPAGLKVLSIDSDGVHILEDGNFFYAVDGLSSRPDSPVDSNLHKLDSRGFFTSTIKEDYSTSTVLTPNSSRFLEARSNSEPSLTDSSSESLGKHVRFSTEPIVVYSTHSTSEYNRRNEDINPLAASAEYELEKQLEDMELFNVDLVKSPTGLGISILGLGVNNVGGDQKLGIFIKSLTPGGAAEANGQIQVFDQIVEVNGINLVGVSQQFASQTLRNTQDVVHFVLARERDPANSRIAQLLSEQEEDDERQDRNLESWHAFTSVKDPTHSPTDHHAAFSPDGSMGTLHRLLTDADQAARDSASDVDELLMGDEDEMKYSVRVKTDNDSTGLLFTTNPLFMSGTEETALHAAQNHMTSLSSSDQNGWIDSSKPPSVLKGTATAASTKRRQEAVIRLIRIAQQRAEAECTDSEAPAGLTPTVAPVDRTVWILANDLHDCHVQLSKLQTQVQQLEQRLTAQEAAADEAIERLCLQRQHVMLELNESRERLKQCIATQNGHSPCTEESSFHFPLLNGRIPSVNSLVDEKYSSASPAISNVEPTASGSTCTGAGTQPLEGAHSKYGVIPYRLLPPPIVSTSTVPQISKRVSNDAVFLSYSDSPSCHTDAPQSYLNHAYRRVRLINSGGLARRRPPTRLSINPAPDFSLTTTSPLFNQHSPLRTAPSGSSSTTASSVSGPSDVPTITAPIETDPVCIRAPASSDSPSFCIFVAQGTSRNQDDTENLQRASRKVLGVQLPGLSDGVVTSVALRHRSADSSPSTVDDCSKESLSVTSPERRISRI